ncbi:MAG: acyltransferase [Frankiaceae bacterium]|nr:acyltransferase [Frankiaceae bacterium]
MTADRGWTRPAGPVPTRRTRSPGFRGDIEGLRGVAVLLVVFGHVTGWPRGGFVGVDVFFVISGFLITGLLVAERERTGRISIRGFYARRARRLLPAGVLVLVLTDLAASILLLPSRAHETFVDSLWAFGFLANVHFAALGTDYFSLTRAPSAVQHYWSLSVEEQFYLVWPCAILLTFGLAKRAGRRALLGLAALVVLASLAWSVVSTAQTPASAYFSSPARAWELGAGALLVLLNPKRVPGFVAWLGAAGLVASAIVITPTTAVPGYALVLPVASTVAILAAGGKKLGLATAPIRYVGLISYSLYLWHWPVVVLGATVPGGTTALGKAILIALAGVLSVLSYHLVEQPFRRRRPQGVPGPRRASMIAPAYAMVLLAALTATWVLAASPAAQRTARHTTPPVGSEVGTPPVRDLPAALLAGLQLSSWPDGLDADLANAGAPEWLHDKCLDVSDRNASRCTYGSPGATRKVALLGDSVAVSWLPALRRVGSLRDARIHVLTRRQCANLRAEVSPACTQHQDWALEQVRRLRPDVVVMSARYQGGQTPEQWLDGTVRMLAQIAPYTKRIVILTPPPGTGNLQSCYTRLSEPRDCTGQVSERWRTYAGAEQEAATSARAVFVDSRQWFCVADTCPAVVAELPVLFDGRHLTAVYAAVIAPSMVTLFR